MLRRSSTSFAPSPLRYGPSSGLPVIATTSNPVLARISMATDPTPPVAPVTATGPCDGRSPLCSISMIACAAVNPAVPIVIASNAVMLSGRRTTQSPGTRTNSL